MPAPNPAGHQAEGKQNLPKAGPAARHPPPKELIDTSKADRQGLGVAQGPKAPPGPLPRRSSSLGKENPAAKVKDAAARKPEDVQKWYVK